LVRVGNPSRVAGSRRGGKCSTSSRRTTSKRCNDARKAAEAMLAVLEESGDQLAWEDTAKAEWPERLD
jgi:hypothetical protein